jgi:hypothetical protein
MSIKFTTPTPYAVENPDTITNPVELGEWIEQLPVTDPGATAQTLLASVKLLNRHPKVVAQRYELMGIYLHPFLELVQRTRQMVEARPAGERHRNENLFLQTMEELCREMGFGFKRTLVEALEPSWVSASLQDSLAGVIYWISQCLTFDLMFAFADYHPEPRSAWPEFMKLYLLAKQRKLSRTLVEDPVALSGTAPSVGLAFRRALLISIVDPYKLRRGDVWHAYDYLSYFAKNVLVGTFRVPELEGGHFLVDLKGAIKPQPFRLDRIPPRPREFLLINVNPLNNVVHRHFKMLEVNQDVEIEGIHNMEGPHALHLFRTMLVNWHISPSRRHERIEQYDWLTAICGLENICCFLKGEECSADQEIPEEEEVEISEHLTQIVAVDRKAYRWRQTDFSASGVGVVLPVSEAKAMQVGQLVLVESEQARGGARRRVGIVRRLVRRDNGNLEAGLQFVGNNFTATEIHHRDKPLGVLLVDRGERFNKLLITPSKVHRSGRIIQIKTGPKTNWTVKAGKLLEATCCLERFEIEKR